MRCLNSAAFVHMRMPSSLMRRWFIEKRSNRSIVKEYGVDHNAVQRHRQHIPQLLVKAAQAEEIARADTLLDRLDEWTARMEKAIEAVESFGDCSTFFKGVTALRPYMETIGEITKELERLSDQITPRNLRSFPGARLGARVGAGNSFAMSSASSPPFAERTLGILRTTRRMEQTYRGVLAMLEKCVPVEPDVVREKRQRVGS
jgi:hypothetical protein